MSDLELQEILRRTGEAYEQRPPARCIGVVVDTRGQRVPCDRPADRTGWRCSACAEKQLYDSRARRQAREADRMREQEAKQGGRSSARLAAAMRGDTEGER